MPLLPVMLVYAKRAGIENRHLVQRLSPVWCVRWPHRCRHHRRYEWGSWLGRMAMALYHRGRADGEKLPWPRAHRRMQMLTELRSSLPLLPFSICLTSLEQPGGSAPKRKSWQPIDCRPTLVRTTGSTASISRLSTA